MSDLIETIRTFSSETAPLDFVLILENWELFATGLKSTLILMIASLVMGGMIAVPLAIIRAKRVPILNQFAFCYIYFLRGTPALVQLYVVYYGLSQFDFIRDSAAWVILREPWWCAIIVFTIGTSAYTAEIFHGAIKDTPRGEVEAAIASGMSSGLAMRRIILPSAFRRALPAYANEVIFNLHSTVLASVVTVMDILGAARLLNNRYYLAYEGFVTAAVLFIVIVFVITRIFNFLEKRLFGHLHRPAC